MKYRLILLISMFPLIAFEVSKAQVEESLGLFRFWGKDRKDSKRSIRKWQPWETRRQYRLGRGEIWQSRQIWWEKWNRSCRTLKGFWIRRWNHITAWIRPTWKEALAPGNWSRPRDGMFTNFWNSSRPNGIHRDGMDTRRRPCGSGQEFPER